MTIRIELIFIDLAAQSIAVNAENFGSPGLVAVRAIQNALNETLFKLTDCFVKQNTALYHLVHEPFQLVFHDGTLRYFLCEGLGLLVLLIQFAP